jgi:hypothetical protein
MEMGQKVLTVIVLLVLFAPLAYVNNFLFSELTRKWGVFKFISALSVFTFVSFILYVWLFLRFQMAGLAVIYLLILGQSVAGVSFFREEFRECVRNTMNGLRKQK